MTAVSNKQSVRPRISLIAARADNGVIGFQGDMPWSQPADLKHFRKLTLGKTVLMGRRTWDTLGKPLPGRTNWVMTRDPQWQQPGAIRVGSVDEALKRISENDSAATELMVIGGEAVYREFLPFAHTIYLTEIHVEPEGDTWFPELSAENWEEVDRQFEPADDYNSCSMDFVVLKRRAYASSRPL